MAGPTEKQFQDLIKEQQRTNEILDSQKPTVGQSLITGAGEIAAVVFEGQQAKKESDATQKEMKDEHVEDQKVQEAQKTALESMAIGLSLTGSAAKEEEDDAKAGDKKRGKLFQTMASSLSYLRENMPLAGMVKGGWSALKALMKGTFLAALLVGLLAFLESDLWKSMKETLVNITAKFIDWNKDTLIPFKNNLATFMKDRSWENFLNIFGGVEDPKSLAYAVAGIAVLLKPSLVTSALKLAVGTMKTAFNLLGPIVKTMGSTLSTLGTSITNNVLTPMATAVKNAAVAAWSFLTNLPTHLSNLATRIKTNVLAPLKTAITNAAVAAWGFLVTIGQKITALAAAMRAQILVPIQTAIKNAAVSAWGFLVTVGTKITALGAALKAQILVPIQTAVTNAAAAVWTKILLIPKALLTLKGRIIAQVLTPLQGAVANAAGKLWTAIKLIPPAIVALQAFFVGTFAPMLTAALVPLAPFIAIAAGIGVTLYALWKAFEDFQTTLDETGSIGEALKVGISKFMGTILGFIPNLVLKLVGWVGGLFGFDDFKARVQNIDVIQFISDKIGGMFDGIFGWLGDLFDIDWEGLMTNLVPDWVKNSKLGSMLGFGANGNGDNGKTSIPHVSPANPAGGVIDEWGGVGALLPKKFMGGPFRAGVPMLVGEGGPEAVIFPHRGGRVINAQRTDAMRNSMIQRRLDGMGGMGSQPIIASTNVANTNSTNITHTTTSIVNPDLVVSTVNKAA